MSDSSNEHKKFDAHAFAKKLCADKKVSLNSYTLQFREGWKGIFETFIQEVGGYSIRIEEVTDEYKFMYIEVDLRQTTMAKKIYNQILRAKDTSLRTCAHCGGEKRANGKLFCPICTENAAELKTTGTWLDEF